MSRKPVADINAHDIGSMIYDTESQPWRIVGVQHRPRQTVIAVHHPDATGWGDRWPADEIEYKRDDMVEVGNQGSATPGTLAEALADRDYCLNLAVTRGLERDDMAEQLSRLTVRRSGADNGASHDRH